METHAKRYQMHPRPQVPRQTQGRKPRPEIHLQTQARPTPQTIPVTVTAVSQQKDIPIMSLRPTSAAPVIVNSAAGSWGVREQTAIDQLLAQPSSIPGATRSLILHNIVNCKPTPALSRETLNIDLLKGLIPAEIIDDIKGVLEESVQQCKNFPRNRELQAFRANLSQGFKNFLRLLYNFYANPTDPATLSNLAPIQAILGPANIFAMEFCSLLRNGFRQKHLNFDPVPVFRSDLTQIPAIHYERILGIMRKLTQPVTSKYSFIFLEANEARSLERYFTSREQSLALRYFLSQEMILSNFCCGVETVYLIPDFLKFQDGQPTRSQGYKFKDNQFIPYIF